MTRPRTLLVAAGICLVLVTAVLLGSREPDNAFEVATILGATS